MIIGSYSLPSGPWLTIVDTSDTIVGIPKYMQLS